MVGANTYGMQVGFIFKAGAVDVRILGFGFPGCNGFTLVPATAIGANKFETSSMGGNDESNLLKGRWVGAGKVKGKLVLARPQVASCGDPGTYVYKYAARRYGRP
ncbi:MAG: hypothetical protein ABI726_07155 [bacterium]